MGALVWRMGGIAVNLAWIELSKEQKMYGGG